MHFIFDPFSMNTGILCCIRKEKKNLILNFKETFLLNQKLKTTFLTLSEHILCFFNLQGGNEMCENNTSQGIITAKRKYMQP